MQEINIFIHGVPCGLEVWGPEKDRDYIKTFYTTPIDDVFHLFKIEILRSKTFYTYYIHNNAVYDVNGRPGSYFALTISIEGAYFKEASLLYKIFDAVFKQLCLNRIIDEKHGKYHYLIQDFNDKSKAEDINKIKLAFEQQIKKFQTNIIKLDDNCIQNNKSIIKYSLNDIDSPAFYEELKSNIILISPEYPSFHKQYKTIHQQYHSIKTQLTDKEEKYNNLYEQYIKLSNGHDKLVEENTHLSSKIKSIEEKISSRYQSEFMTMKSMIDSLQKSNAEKDDVNKQISIENKQLKDELKKIKNIHEINKAIKQIEEPIKELSRLVASRFPEDDKTPNKKNKENKKTLISTILLSLILILTTFQTTRSLLGNDNNIGNEKYITEIKKLKETTLQYERLLTNYKNIIPATELNKNDAHINITEFSGQGYLKKGTSYTISVPSQYKGGIFSVSENATLKHIFTIDKGDSVTITYKTGTSCISRTVPVEQ